MQIMEIILFQLYKFEYILPIFNIGYVLPLHQIYNYPHTIVYTITSIYIYIPVYIPRHISSNVLCISSILH